VVDGVVGRGTLWICAFEENVEAMEIKEIRRACERETLEGDTILTCEPVPIAQ
jgi:hypothetical protein